VKERRPLKAQRGENAAVGRIGSDQDVDRAVDLPGPERFQLAPDDVQGD
jgi:hypothetical protein